MFSAYSDVRPNALRTARITGIFKTCSILQGETHTSILDYIFGLFYLSMPPKRRAGWKGETGEKEEEAVATKVSISVFFTPL